MNREYITEEEIEYVSTEIAKTITISDDINGNSRDITRNTTKPEREIIYNLVRGALLSYGWRDTNEEQCILDTVEYTLMQFFPECNCYITIYMPLRYVFYGNDLNKFNNYIKEIEKEVA